MSILVTGGLGYIGSHTVISLLEENYNVVIIDNLSNSNIKVLDKIKEITKQDKVNYYNLDCRDDLTEIFENHKIEGIIHFAAYKSVGESVTDPLKYYDNNLNSLINLLKYCDKYNVKKFVFSSSCSVYGNIDKNPVNEETMLNDPESPYAYTKLVGERILGDWLNARITLKTKDNARITLKTKHNSSVIILRYFNPVGAHESGLIGDNGTNNIMPVICNSVFENKILKIFGNDYNTFDGTCIRDYVHVSDIADAHVLAIKTYSKDSFNIFNLGSEKGLSVLELISAFEKVNDVKVKIQIVEKRPGDIEKIYSDSSKAKKLLKWIPKKTVEDMVKSAWKWTLYRDREIKNLN